MGHLIKCEWGAPGLCSTPSQCLGVDVQEYATAQTMMADPCLKLGYAHTLGFYEVGDGGEAWYTVSASGTANSMDVLACKNGLTASLETPYTVGLVQLGATRGTVVDSQLARAYAIAKEGGIDVVLDHGTYTLSQPFTASLGVHFRVDGFVEFDSTYTDSTGGALWTIDNDLTAEDYQNPAKMGDVFAGGQVFFNRNNDFYDTVNNVDTVCLRITHTASSVDHQDTCLFEVPNVAVMGFGCAVEIVNVDTYLFTFRDCYFEGNTVGVRFADGVDNSGENIRFDGCTFGHCSRAVVADGSPQLTFNDCSFDYNAAVFRAEGENNVVYVTGGHIEATGRIEDRMWQGMSSQPDYGCIAYNASATAQGPNVFSFDNVYIHFNDGVQHMMFEANTDTDNNWPSTIIRLKSCFYSAPTALPTDEEWLFASTTKGVAVLFEGEITQRGVNRSFLDNPYAYQTLFRGLPDSDSLTITEEADQAKLNANGIAYVRTNSYAQANMTIKGIEGDYGTTGFSVACSNGTGGEYYIDLGPGPFSYMLKCSATHELTTMTSHMFLMDPQGWNPPYDGANVWQACNIIDPSTDVSNTNYEWDASTKSLTLHEKVPIDTKGRHLVLRLVPYRATDYDAVGFNVTYVNVTPGR